jgi:hypothetical protein
MITQDILPQLKNVRRTVTGWMARCPTHDDEHNSLSISEGEGGRLLLFCHAGCPFERIISALEIVQSQCQIVQTYDYEDEHGALLFQVCRTEPKGFFQRRPDGNGGFLNNTKGVRKVLYRLPELLESDPSLTVFIVEGEKDVEALRDVGLVATCNTGGAGKWDETFSEYLQNRDAVLLPDNDPTGHSHMGRISNSLRGYAKSLKIVSLPGLPEKGDVSDWLAAGGTVEKLLELVQSTDIETAPSSALVMSFSELMDRSFTDGEPIAGHACRGEIMLVQSVTNHGKSTFIRNAAIALTTGAEFLPFVQRGQPKKVLLLNLEGAGGRFQYDLRVMTRDFTPQEMELLRQNLFPTHPPPFG